MGIQSISYISGLGQTLVYKTNSLKVCIAGGEHTALSLASRYRIYLIGKSQKKVDFLIISRKRCKSFFKIPEVRRKIVPVQASALDNCEM